MTIIGIVALLIVEVGITIVRTFILVAFIPKIFTLSDSISSAAGMLKNMFSEISLFYNYGLDRLDFWLAILSIILVFGASILKEKRDSNT